MCSVLSLSVPKFSCVIGPGRPRWYCPSNTVFEVLDIYSKGRGKNSVNQRRGDGKRNPKTYQEHSSNHWSIVAVLISPNDFEHGKDVQWTYRHIILVCECSWFIPPLWSSDDRALSLFLFCQGMAWVLISYSPLSRIVFNSTTAGFTSIYLTILLYHQQNINYKLLIYYSSTIHHY